MKHKKRKVVELNCIPLYPDHKYIWDCNHKNFATMQATQCNKGETLVIVSKGIAKAFLVV